MESSRVVWFGKRIILLAYFTIGSMYAVYTPAWQAPDEPAHYNYIRGVVETGRLPVLQTGDYDQSYLSQITSRGFPVDMALDTLRYEGHQPPLYYLLAAPIFILSGGSILALRLFSLFLGGGAVLLSMLCTHTLFPSKPAMVLAVSGFIAFLPQNLAMMASVNNDALAALLMSSGLWLLLRRHAGWASGIVIGLAMLAKVTVYVLVPVTVLALIVRARRRRWNWSEFLSVILPILVLGGLWWGRNILVYGWPDALGLQRHADIVVGQPRSVTWLSSYGLVGFGVRFVQTSFQSFWGNFGWMGVPMGAQVYRLLGLFSLLMASGLFIAFRRRPSLFPWQRDGMMLLAVTGFVVFIQYLVYNLTFVQHQGRYLFPALVPLALACAVATWGWATILAGVWPSGAWALRWLPAVLAPGMAALSLYALFGVLIPSFS